MSISNPNWRIMATTLLIGAALLSACGEQPPPTPEESGVPIVVDDLAVIVDGRLNPARSVHLSFKNGGEIAAVLIEEGDQVDEGQVLLRLADGEQLQAAVTASELELINARIALQALYDGAGLMAAQAQLDLATAQDALRDAERKWQYQQEGYRASSVTIKAAEAELQVAKSQMEGSKSEYDDYSGLSSDDPRRAQAYKNYAAAYQRYQTALSSINWYKGYPTEIQQAILDAEVALSEAQVDEAERLWSNWAEGPGFDELQLAETRLANAEAHLLAAEAALSELEITAPFSGTVASLLVQEGELAAPGQQAMALADFSSWKVDTENLTEIDLPQISLGQTVEITFDALPEIGLSGIVEAISPTYEMRGGDVTYSVEIGLLDTHESLQWGMTSIVTFGEPTSKAAQLEEMRLIIGH
jgi:HlyD family secretion protein